jgi:biotin transport system substrate-specific component
VQTNSAVMTAPTLIDAAWPAQSSLMRSVILAVAGSAFLALCAKIQVPMIPVPMTMQTFGVLAIGAAYGWPLGAITVMLYLAEGFVGLPVFACAANAAVCGGPAYFAGPTGGYLVGFVVAAGVVGWLCERHHWDRKPIQAAGAMILGNLVIYAFGLAWLHTLFGTIRGVANWTFARTWAAGAANFLYGDLVKIVLAAALLPLAWTLVQRFRRGS